MFVHLARLDFTGISGYVLICPYKLREQSLSLTGTGAEGNQQGYEIFLMRFAEVWNFLDPLCWGMKQNEIRKENKIASLK